MKVYGNVILDDQVKKCRLKFKNESDRELHNNFINYMHNGIEGNDYKGFIYALKTIEILKENYPHSEYILKCYRGLKFVNLCYDETIKRECLTHSL